MSTKVSCSNVWKAAPVCTLLIALGSGACQHSGENRVLRFQYNPSRRKRHLWLHAALDNLVRCLRPTCQVCLKRGWLGPAGATGPVNPDKTALSLLGSPADPVI